MSFPHTNPDPDQIQFHALVGPRQIDLEALLPALLKLLAAKGYRLVVAPPDASAEEYRLLNPGDL